MMAEGLEQGAVCHPVGTGRLSSCWSAAASRRAGRGMLPEGARRRMPQDKKKNPPDRCPAGGVSWSGRRGSNPRPRPWQGRALPAEPRPHCKACSAFGHPSSQGGANGGDARIRTGGEGFAGLCLTTWPRRRVAAKPSWKRPAKTLEYDRPRDDDGADDGVRTRDPDLGKVVLYQLSHVRVARRYNTGTATFAQAPISDFFTSR